jgi:tetratricopeptide (TPR) repeat protein
MKVASIGVILVCAAGLQLPVLGQAAKASVEELYRQATEAMRAKDYSQAVFWFRQMRANYPQDLRSGMALMTLLDAQGQWKEELKIGGEIRPQFKESAIYYLQMGTVLLKLDRAEEALAELQTGLRYSDPTGMTGVIQGRIGSVYMRMERVDDAISAFRKSRALTGRASIELALAFSAKGDVVGEMAEYRAVLKETPGEPVALNNLAYAMAGRNENLNEALAMSRRAVDAGPGNAAFVDTLAWIYFKKGMLPEAESTMVDAVSFEGGTQDTLRKHLVAVMDARGEWTAERRELRGLLENGSKPNEIARMKVLLGKARAK